MSLVRSIVAKAHTDHAAINSDVEHAMAIPGFAQSSGEPGRIADPLFVLPRINVSAIGNSELIERRLGSLVPQQTPLLLQVEMTAARPTQPRELDIHPSRIAAAIELRIEEFQAFTSSNQNAGPRSNSELPFLNRFGDAPPLDGLRPQRDLARANREAIFAAFSQSSQVPDAVETLVSTAANIAYSTSSTDGRFQTLDQSVSTVAVESTPSSSTLIPSSGAFSTTYRYDSTRDDKGVSAASSSPSDGGMIELRTLKHLDGSAKGNDAAKHVPESRWQIRQETIDGIVESSESEMQVDSTSNDSIIVTHHPRDGGMIAIASTPLPVTMAKAFDVHCDIELDRSIGRFRSFQIAAAPGHDVREAQTSGETLVSLRAPGSSPNSEYSDGEYRDSERRDEESSGDDATAQFALLESPLAFASVAVVSAMIVIVESRSSKDKDTGLTARTRH